jgi:hypothetical protein
MTGDPSWPYLAVLAFVAAALVAAILAVGYLLTGDWARAAFCAGAAGVATWLAVAVARATRGLGG